MTSDLIEQARALRDSGASYAEISRQLSVPPTSVARNLKPFELHKQELIIPPGPNPYELEPSAVANLPPDDFSAEIAVLRTELLKAKQKGAPSGVIEDLAGTIATVGHKHQAAQIRGNKMLGIGTIVRLGEAMVHLFIDEFHDVPGWEEKIDRILHKLAPLTATAQNDQKTINLLLGRAR